MTTFLKRMVATMALGIMGTTVQAAQSDDQQYWNQILERAKGQTVYFNAWGGSQVINDYIRWAADRVEAEYAVSVKHVKVTDTGDVVSRVLAQKTAGRDSDGSVDLVWINGENFKAMKQHGLLSAPFTADLPNYALVDVENKPSTLFDFTTPVEHLEAPWGMAQLVFSYDSAHIETPPNSMHELLQLLEKYPGRFTYPALPNFHGTTFVKQALLELVEDPSVLSEDVSKADFARVTAPLWQYLDKLHPLMWRQGKAFAQGAPQMKSLMNDGEILLSFSFNPNDVANAIANDELPHSVKSYVHTKGSLGNSHFVAIAFNAKANEGAQVFANFLLSPEAQLRKADIAVWGDPTVLAMSKLSVSQRQAFTEQMSAPGQLNSEQLGRVLAEPHSSWVSALEKAWLARYAQ
ncbi:MAG: ABC transporter substrate-binding protein [Pseudomonadales bacterium]